MLGPSFCMEYPSAQLSFCTGALCMEHPFARCALCMVCLLHGAPFAWNIPSVHALHSTSPCMMCPFAQCLPLCGLSFCMVHPSTKLTFHTGSLCTLHPLHHAFFAQRILSMEHPWCSACFARPIPLHGVSFCIPLCAPSFCMEHPSAQLTFCTVHPFARRIPLHGALPAQSILFAQSTVHCRAALQSRAKLRCRQHPDQTAPWGGGVPSPPGPGCDTAPSPCPRLRQHGAVPPPPALAEASLRALGLALLPRRRRGRRDLAVLRHAGGPRALQRPLLRRLPPAGAVAPCPRRRRGPGAVGGQREAGGAGAVTPPQPAVPSPCPPCNKSERPATASPASGVGTW